MCAATRRVTTTEATVRAVASSTTHYEMFALIIIGAILLSTSTDVVQGKYVYRPQISGWLAQHKLMSSWDEAYQQCRSEDYAVLASPTTTELLEEMTSLMAPDTLYHIGTRAMYTRAPYMSVEGVALEDMAVTHMFDRLDALDGECLSMSRQEIRVVTCDSRLPFMCLKQHDADMKTTECGTYDKDYKLDLSTGTCYKLHNNKKTWYQAYSTCVAEGAHLAVFNDEHETLVLKNMTLPADGYPVFVGLRDREGNGDWMSVHGSRVEQIYNVWIWDHKPSNRDYRCGRIDLQTAKLNIQSCDAEGTFLCERDPTNMRFR